MIPHRIATGCIDRILAVRVETAGAVPELVVETMRRSPCEVGDSAWTATAEAVRCQIQFAGLLLEQVRHAVEQALPRAGAE